jgi:hypothetical protein
LFVVVLIVEPILEPIVESVVEPIVEPRNVLVVDLFEEASVF